MEYNNEQVEDILERVKAINKRAAALNKRAETISNRVVALNKSAETISNHFSYIDNNIKGININNPIIEVKAINRNLASMERILQRVHALNARISLKPSTPTYDVPKKPVKMYAVSVDSNELEEFELLSTWKSNTNEK